MWPGFPSGGTLAIEGKRSILPFAPLAGRRSRQGDEGQPRDYEAIFHRISLPKARKASRDSGLAKA